MSKAPFVLLSISTVSKLDTAGWSRELWNAAHAMARRMIRDRAGHGIGAAWTWYLDHARKRFSLSKTRAFSPTSPSLPRSSWWASRTLCGNSAGFRGRLPGTPRIFS